MKIRALAGWVSILFVALLVIGCKSSAINPDFPAITTQPTNQTVTAGQTATFSVTATGAAPLNYQWFKNGFSITGATSSSYTTPPAESADNNAFFFVYISNALGSTESNVVTLTVNPAKSSTTLRGDNARTGLNSNEAILTPENVNASGFGKLGYFSVDGAVDAQPLYLSEVNVPGKGVHDILYVATENDTVFAFDAFSGAILWQANVAGHGETPGDNSGCNPATPNAGVTATPVIDRTRGPNSAIYLIAKSRDAAGNSYERLHALDVSTGAELFGGPTTIPVSLTGGAPAFDAAGLRARGGLLASNGHVYALWGLACAAASPASSLSPVGASAWIVAFDAGNLAVAGTLNNGAVNSQGSAAGIGGTLTADATGNLFFAGVGSIQLPATESTAPQLAADGNFADGSILLLPDMTDKLGKVWRLAVNAGADGNLYVLNRDSQTGAGPASKDVVQRLDGVFTSGAADAGLAFFNNTVYVAAAGSGVRSFSITNARISSIPASQTSGILGQSGASLSVSAHATANAILWVMEGGDSAVLHAYDATDLSRELYNSKQAQGGRDDFGPGNAALMPLVMNGRIYVVTSNGVAVFGLLR